MAVSSTPPPNPKAPPAPPPAAGAPEATAGPAPSAPTMTIDPMRLLRVYWPWLAATGVVSAVLGLALFVVLGILAPKFRSFAIYEVMPPPSVGVEDGGVLGMGGREELETYMETQVEVITSNKVLQQAVQQPEIEQHTKWAKQFISKGAFNNVEALKELREIVNARVVPETRLIQMSVIAGNPTDATIIARAVSDVFMRDNSAVQTRDTQARVEDFQRQFRELRQDLSALDIQIENVIAEEKITSANEETSIYYTEVQNLNITMVEIRASLAGAREQLSQYENLMNAPGGVVYPEGIRAEAERGPVASQLEAEIETAEAYLRSSRERFGESHRSVRQQESTIRALREQRDLVVQREMAELFNATVEGLQRSIASLTQQEDEVMTSREEAQVKLNEITAALKLKENLESERAQKMARIEFLDDQIAQGQLLIDMGSRIRTIAAPEEPDTRSFPKPLPVVGLTMFLLTGAVGGLIFLKEIREQRIRTPQDVALIPRTRVLGVLPDISLDPTAPERVETACIDRPEGGFAEAIRQMRTTILREARENDLRSVVFASGMPGSGSTSIVCNLAINAALIDVRVLLIDANLRRPRVHKVFDLEEGPGLSEVLKGKATLDEVVRPTGVEHLSVLQAGLDRENAFERFNTETMLALRTAVRERYDLILLDAPPTIVSGDALTIATKVDASVLVVRAYSENRGLVAKVRNQLDDAHARFLGVVVNAIKPSAGGYMKRNLRVSHEYGLGPEAGPAEDGADAVAVAEDEPKA
jgi:succinoglycan biosynthesis transport protein ExoP